MRKIRVLLADDHETILTQLRVTLVETFDVVGSVNNGLDAIAAVEHLDPDVVVMDISMPIIDGIEAAFRLRLANPRTRVVFLTVHKDEDYVDAAFAAGAYGYVTKIDVETDLIPAIHEALAGHIFVSQSVPRSWDTNED
jgi:DNA-binding NarL/FixJ family response regulator